ncbi:hypothetical protein [Pseudoalteromonas obscura]|uniref:Uncharacterized protein n=1 Tax=Pseudoalteromonas obscura TaxID=3048491 RepID=A0ABT7EJL7_9GAMM|nr:hypothetical protein [Pseudoalteromonas sp. P94(2023)]MDK2595234.1 hypothetical protein [Pseudoalteromonas sp. P94(2023)]
MGLVIIALSAILLMILIAAGSSFASHSNNKLEKRLLEKIKSTSFYENFYQEEKQEIEDTEAHYIAFQIGKAQVSSKTVFERMDATEGFIHRAEQYYQKCTSSPVEIKQPEIVQLKLVSSKK